MSNDGEQWWADVDRLEDPDKCDLFAAETAKDVKRAAAKAEKEKAKRRKGRSASVRAEKKRALTTEGVEAEVAWTTLQPAKLGRKRQRKIFERSEKPKAPASTSHKDSWKGYVPAATNVTAAQRVKEHPDDGLIVDAKNQVFCKPCKKQIKKFWKKTQVAQHVAGKKHKERVAELAAKQKLAGDGRSMDDYLARALGDEEFGIKVGTTLETDLHMARLRAIRALLKVGSNINALCSENGADLKDLLEEGLHCRIGEDRTLRDYIPTLLHAEILRIKDELAENPGGRAILFDGTTRVCEVEAVLLRFAVKGKVELLLSGDVPSVSSLLFAVPSATACGCDASPCQGALRQRGGQGG
jgi:hypothetical protein